MAITIRQQPGLWAPVYNPMMFVISSTNVLQSNFRYLVQLYVNGSATPVTLPISPDPTHARAYFDAHRILESYVTSDIEKTGWGFNDATGSHIEYEVEFGEQYGPSSGITNYPALTVTGTKYAFNAAYDVDEFVDYNGTIAIESTGAVLSSQPLTRVTSSDLLRDQYLHYITNTSGSVYFAEIKTYDSSGNLLGTYKIENQYQAATISRRQYFKAGSRALNAATLYSGVQPVITSNVASYTVNFTNWAGASQLAGGVPFTYTRNSNCPSGREPITLHWKNYLGGFDSHEFYLINRYKTKTTKAYWQKTLGTRALNAWSYAKQDGGKQATDTRVQGRYELQSDWVTLEDSAYFMGLIESPEVYVDDGTKLLRANIVSPTEAELQDEGLGNVELQSVKIIAELSNENWRQRG
jgi:hypothetical protein